MTTPVDSPCSSRHMDACLGCYQALPENPFLSMWEEVVIPFCGEECATQWNTARAAIPHDGFTDDDTANRVQFVASGLCPASSAFDFNGMDLSVRPQDDFFHYAVGNWIKDNEIPEGYSRWGTFSQLSKMNTERLKNLFQGDFQVDSHDDELAINFYKSYCNLESQEEAGLGPVQGILDQINGITGMDGLVAAIGSLQASGFSVFFSKGVAPHPKDNSKNILHIGQGGLNLGDYEIYLEENDTEANKNAEKRAAYHEYLETIHSLAGASEAEAKASATAIFNIEREFASAFLTKEERRDVELTTNIFTIEEANAEFQVDARVLFAAIGISPEVMDITNPRLIKKVFSVLASADLEMLKDYMKFKCINAVAPALGKAFYDAHFHLYSRVMNGVEESKPLEERATDYTMSFLGDAVGKLYVKKFFSPGQKAKVVEMVDVVREAIAERIAKLNWMEDETKEKAIEKVQQMEVQVGYADDEHWTDYSTLNSISSDQPLASNMLDILRFEEQRDLAKLGKDVDRQDWPWPPQTVNACNSPDLNKINFPAGILQEPFFTDDPAVSWGAFGMVICHEIIHSFDDQGRKYDLNGNQADWWKEADAERFEAHAKVIVEQFNNYPMHFADGSSQNVRGELCLGENIADLGGLNIAFAAFKKTLESNPLQDVNGFTPEQRFFLGFAQVWRYKIQDALARNHLNNDPHSPPLWRVNGSLSQIPEFKAAFSLPDECPMVVPEDKRSKMWTDES
ncbi:MAG: putative endopeptidase [Chlamydiales bacterium]|jgi:putative endopeptidase